MITEHRKGVNVKCVKLQDGSLGKRRDKGHETGGAKLQSIRIMELSVERWGAINKRRLRKRVMTRCEGKKERSGTRNETDGSHGFQHQRHVLGLLARVGVNTVHLDYRRTLCKICRDDHWNSHQLPDVLDVVASGRSAEAFKFGRCLGRRDLTLL